MSSSRPTVAAPTSTTASPAASRWSSLSWPALDTDPDPDPFSAGLGETGALVERLDEVRARHARCHPGACVVVLVATVSNGEDISEIHGSAALADVTRQLAARLVADDDRVVPLRASSLGGLAAALLLPVTGQAETERAAEELAARLDGFVSVAGGARVWPVVTTGLRRCCPDEASRTALRDVRAALFDAGRSHRGTARWHRTSDALLPAGGDLGLVGDLAQALLEDPDQITLHYQPVFDLRSRTLISSEALMRWRHPERGPVSPLDAVGAAERSGLIHRLGRRVLDLALAQTAAWAGQVGPSYRTHVNVSAVELQEAGYVDVVDAALRRAGVPPHALLLEITETAMLSEDRSVLRTLHDLRALGVGLGIDDFGTGYSSIAQLHRLPIDTVKVDRSLVRGIGTSASDFSLLRTVLGLLATTEVTIIAEGIEDAVQASHLQAVGATFGQGYLLGRPVPAEAFLHGAGPRTPSSA